MTAILLPLVRPKLLYFVYYFDTRLRLRNRAYSLDDLMRSFTPEIVSGELPENHGVAGNLLNGAVENLVILPQKISVMNTIDHHGCHLACAVVFHRSLNH